MMKFVTTILLCLVLALILHPHFVLAQDFQSGTCETNGGNNTNVGQPICNPAPNLFSVSFCKGSGGCSFGNIITNVIILILGLSGLIALGYIILGGYQLVTSRGNDEAFKSGRKTITNAIIGLVIILLSYLIITIVINAVFGNVNGNLPSRPTTPNYTNTLPGITP